jgi:hypothetical protein
VSKNKSVYKIVEKVLAIRLRLVMGKAISKKGCMIFKVDFEKAYNSVNWKFLEYMLTRFGFGEKWIVWMKACVFRENRSVLVNSSPIEQSGVHGFL